MRAMPEAYALMLELAAVLGVKKIHEMPGCWEVDVDENWFIAVNGHSHPARCSRGAFVSPFSMYVEWCGWPAGEVDALGGIIAAGAAANESSFCAALALRVSTEKSPPHPTAATRAL